LEALKEFSEENSSLLMEVVIPKLFGLLKGANVEGNKKSLANFCNTLLEKPYLTHIFHCLTTLCQSPAIFKQVTAQFLELLSVYFTGNIDNSLPLIIDVNNVSNSYLLQSTFKTLTRITFNNKENTSVAMTTLISPILALFINNSSKNIAKFPDEVIQATTHFLKMISQQISPE
jgi:hypothetical protein